MSEGGGKEWVTTSAHRSEGEGGRGGEEEGGSVEDEGCCLAKQSVRERVVLGERHARCTSVPEQGYIAPVDRIVYSPRTGPVHHRPSSILAP